MPRPPSARPARPRPQNRRPAARSRHGWRTLLRLCLTVVLLFAAVLLWAVLARHFSPNSNTNRQSFDAIIVLGTPADSDGNPSPEMLARVSEGVQEYERGVAPHLIFTGTAAHNRFVEAKVMGRVARAQGVPASAILEETKAWDTIQNACYSNQILKAHGWNSVEVVSSASHLPRAAMIFSNLPGPKLEWRMHSDSDLLTSAAYRRAAILVETIKTARYLVWTRWTESCGQ